MATATTAPVHATLPVELVVGNVYKLPISMIRDDRKWKNKRKHMDPDVLEETYNSIRANGLLQNIVCSIGENNLLDVLAGFRRTHCCKCVALYKLVAEVNKRDKVLSGVKFPVKKNADGEESFIGFDIVKNLEHFKSFVEQFPQEVEAAYNDYLIDVKIGEAKNETEAALINITENKAREEISVADLCVSIKELLANGQNKASYIARMLGEDASKISQLQKIGRLPEIVHEMLDNHPDISPEALPQHQEHVNVIVNELSRRMSIHAKMKNGDEYLSMSAARDLVNFLTAGPTGKSPGIAESNTAKTTMDLLCKLLRINDNFQPTKEPTTQYGPFKKLRENCLHQRDAELAKRAAGDAGDDAVVGDAAAVETAAGTPTKTGEGTTDKPDTVKPAAGAAAPTTGKSKDEIEAEINAANAVGDGVEVDDMSNDSLVASTQIDDGDVVEAGPTATAEGPGNAADAGKARGETKTVVSNRYNLRELPSIESSAKEACSHALKADTHPIDRIVQIANAAELYRTLGLNADGEACEDRYIAYSEALMAYWDALQGFLVDAEKAGLKFPLPVPGVDAMTPS